jgi:uncharacterized protein YdhG (YjbR/CyaY superfamily)
VTSVTGDGRSGTLPDVASGEIDAYLADVPEPQRSTLTALRAALARIIPEGEECIAYGVPCIKANGAAVAGYAAYDSHCSYFPMSGTVLAGLADEVAGYRTSKGALQFGIDRSLPVGLVRSLVRARLAEVAAVPGAAKPRS